MGEDKQHGAEQLSRRGKGSCAEGTLAAVQVAVLAELSKHTQMDVSRICPGTALAPAGTAASGHAQLSPVAAIGKEPIPEQAARGGNSKAEPLPHAWSVPRSPWLPQSSSRPF